MSDDPRVVLERALHETHRARAPLHDAVALLIDVATFGAPPDRQTGGDLGPLPHWHARRAPVFFGGRQRGTYHDADPTPAGK